MGRAADVIIVGGGLSGLIAARTLIAAGKEPLIIEADERIGGRILTNEAVPGINFELGAQWIGDTHYRMQALAEEFGVGIYEQFDEGESSYEMNGPVMRGDAFAAQYADELEGITGILATIDEYAATVVVDKPWETPRADEWDRVTASAWVDTQGLGPVARELFEICCVGILAVPTSEVSLLHMLYNVAVCGVGAELFAESEGGAQTKRFDGGSSQIPLRLAASLGSERILLNSPVQGIDYSDDSVTVHIRGGESVRGKQVIVALAPTLAGRIMYDPPLPGKRDQLTQRIPQASAVKVFAVYDEPFWRADGLNGQLISTEGPARMSNDSHFNGSDAGVILAFLEGEQARTFGRLPQDELHQLVVDELTRHFGPKAAKPEHVVSGEWSNRQWTRGCYNANLGPHGWTHFGSALSAPIGPIKWAATETANEWSAYMEGAVEAGERAANEVIESLD